MTYLARLIFFFCVVVQSNLTIADAQNLPTLVPYEIRVSDIPNSREILDLQIYDDDQILSWIILLPSNYDPKNPPGVIVYVSPTAKGTPPKSWFRVLENENMIFISANNAGNLVPANRRMANAVLAINIVRAEYKINPDRRIIAGFSGGARVSCLLVEAMPKLFTGAIFMGGALKWQGDKTSMNRMLSDGTYVFLTGRNDHARKETIETFWQYRRRSDADVHLLDNRFLGHSLPKARQFEKALSYF